MEMIRKRRTRDYWSTDLFLHTPIFHSRKIVCLAAFVSVEVKRTLISVYYHD